MPPGVLARSACADRPGASLRALERLGRCSSLASSSCDVTPWVAGRLASRRGDDRRRGGAPGGERAPRPGAAGSWSPRTARPWRRPGRPPPRAARWPPRASPIASASWPSVVADEPEQSDPDAVMPSWSRYGRERVEEPAARRRVRSRPTASSADRLHGRQPEVVERRLVELVEHRHRRRRGRRWPAARGRSGARQLRRDARTPRSSCRSAGASAPSPPACRAQAAGLQRPRAGGVGMGAVVALGERVDPGLHVGLRAVRMSSDTSSRSTRKPK